MCSSLFICTRALHPSSAALAASHISLPLILPIHVHLKQRVIFFFCCLSLAFHLLHLQAYIQA